MKRPTLTIGPIILDCAVGQAQIMAEFYSALLGWHLSHPAQNGTAAVTSNEKNVLAFQEIETYQVPVWPWQKGTQGPMMHFDIIADDLEEAIRYALGCGAVLAEEMFFDDSRTLFDPAGHPFCIDTHRS